MNANEQSTSNTWNRPNEISLRNKKIESPVKKIYTTSRVNPHIPVVDGRLDDAAWAQGARGKLGK